MCPCLLRRNQGLNDKHACTIHNADDFVDLCGPGFMCCVLLLVSVRNFVKMREKFSLMHIHTHNNSKAHVAIEADNKCV
jgi:hypothetical protein